MVCWGEPRKLGLCCLFCHLLAVGSEAGIVGSVSSVFRGKKGIFCLVFAKCFEIRDCGMLKWLLLLNWGHRDVTLSSPYCVSCVYSSSWHLGDADPWSQQTELLIWSLPNPKWARWPNRSLLVGFLLTWRRSNTFIPMAQPAGLPFQLATEIMRSKKESQLHMKENSCLWLKSYSSIFYCHWGDMVMLTWRTTLQTVLK